MKAIYARGNNSNFGRRLHSPPVHDPSADNSKGPTYQWLGLCIHQSCRQRAGEAGGKVARVSSRDQKVGLGAALSSQPQAFSAGKELPDGVLTPDTGREEA